MRSCKTFSSIISLFYLLFTYYHCYYSLASIFFGWLVVAAAAAAAAVCLYCGDYRVVVAFVVLHTTIFWQLSTSATILDYTIERCERWSWGDSVVRKRPHDKTLVCCAIIATIYQDILLIPLEFCQKWWSPHKFSLHLLCRFFKLDHTFYLTSKPQSF